MIFRILTFKAQSSVSEVSLWCRLLLAFLAMCNCSETNWSSSVLSAMICCNWEHFFCNESSKVYSDWIFSILDGVSNCKMIESLLHGLSFSEVQLNSYLKNIIIFLFIYLLHSISTDCIHFVVKFIFNYINSKHFIDIFWKSSKFREYSFNDLSILGWTEKVLYYDIRVILAK